MRARQSAAPSWIKLLDGKSRDLLSETTLSTANNAFAAAYLSNDLEQAFVERGTGVRWLKVELIFATESADPRFRALVGRLGLPDRRGAAARGVIGDARGRASRQIHDGA